MFYLIFDQIRHKPASMYRQNRSIAFVGYMTYVNRTYDLCLTHESHVYNVYIKVAITLLHLAKINNMQHVHVLLIKFY